MIGLKKSKVEKFAEYYVSFTVFLFLALSVAFQGSYAISGAVIISSYGFLFNAQIRRQIQLSKVEKALVFLLLLYLLSVILEVIIYDVALRRLDPQSKILLFIPLIFLLNGVKIHRLVTVFGFGAGALGLFVLSIYEKYYLGVGRVGTNINAIQLGNIALIIGLSAILLSPIAFRMQRRGLLFGSVLILLGISGIIASIFTLTRGGLVFLPLLILIVMAYNYQYLRRHFGKTLLLISVLILVVGYALPQTGAFSRFKAAAVNVESYFVDGNASTSTGIRFELWKVAALITLENPVFGVGVTQYLAEKERMINRGEIDKSVLTYGHSHNAFFYAAVRRGGVGLLILLALMFYPIWLGHKEMTGTQRGSKPQSLCLLIFGLFFICANLTQVLFAHNSGMIMYTGMLIILVSLVLSGRSQPATSEVRKGTSE